MRRLLSRFETYFEPIYSGPGPAAVLYVGVKSSASPARRLVPSRPVHLALHRIALRSLGLGWDGVMVSSSAFLSSPW